MNSLARAAVLAGVIVVVAAAVWQIVGLLGRVDLNQYDNLAYLCKVSNGRIEVTVDVYRDSDQTTADYIPPAAPRSCEEIRRGMHVTSWSETR